MRLVLAAIAAAALALAGRAVAQAPARDVLQDLCIQTDAQSAPALAKADAAGWTTLPKSAVPVPPSSGFQLDDYAVRLSTTGDRTLVLIVGRGKAQGGPYTLPSDVCMIAYQPEDVDAAGRFKAWLGVQPFMAQASEGMELFMFEDAPTGHAPIVFDAPGKVATLAGKVKMGFILVQPADKVSVLAFVKLIAPPDAPVVASAPGGRKSGE
jgi:hypothetical protein